MLKYTRNKKNIKTVDMMTFVFKTFKELYKIKIKKNLDQRPYIYFSAETVKIDVGNFKNIKRHPVTYKMAL